MHKDCLSEFSLRMELKYVVLYFAIFLINLASSAPVNEISPFLKSVIGSKSIRSGDIPLYSTNPAYVIQTSSVTKRDAGDSDTRHYVIQTTDKIMNIMLYPNKKLLSENFVVQVRKDNGDLEILNVSTKNCYYTGSVAGHSSSKVAASMCDGEMKGIIEVDGNMYVMEPVNDENKDHSHVAYKMERKSMKFEDGNAALPCPTYEVENGQTEHLQNLVRYKCYPHYHLFGSHERKCLPNGEWSGNTPICVKKDALKKVKIQGHQCPKLTNPEWGTVNIMRDAKGLFKAVYKCMPQHSISGDRVRFCSPSGQWSGSTPRCLPAMMMEAYMNGLGTSEKENGTNAHQSSSVSTIELMVYLDANFQNDANQNGFSPIDNALGIINIMSSLFHDSTLEHQIDITLTRLILEDINGAARINIREVSSTLNAFCAYQQSINTPDDSNPLHHDHAILITNADLCGNDGNGGCSTGVIGFAHVGGMCSQSSSCTINEIDGFSTAFTLAHETGHNLGMPHDGSGNVCNNSRRIMAPSNTGQEESLLWSSCSADYLQVFLSSGRGICLEDTPAQKEFDVDAIKLVGLEFNADKQCRAQYGPNAVSCPSNFALNEICHRLWCQPNGEGNCSTNYIPPADGTGCGSTSICVQGQCIDISNTVTPVNGGWSEFGPYNSCSRTCGGGIRYRERQCNNPTPKFGGNVCQGSAREYDLQCNTNECPQ